MDNNTIPTEGTSKNTAAARSIKKEPPEDEIKDFAETAMNELLGWYGYERLELRRWSTSGGRPAAPAVAAAAGVASTVASADAALAHHSGTSMRRDSAGSMDSGPTNTQDRDNDDCAWCNNPIKNDTEILQHSGGTKFCSEVCFSQSRRANFKRAKTCDWCRHVRHTVSYVDFQDGATQLQFCSDKCLNQYKMHIFCRETQAHLDLNPHLVNAASTSSLITPDLWLKNCKSRSASPISEDSTSPLIENFTSVNRSISPKTSATMSSPASTPPQMQKSPMPLITVAHPSKLMKPKRSTLEENLVQRSPPGPKKENRTSKTSSRKRRSSRCAMNATSHGLPRISGTNSVVKLPDMKLLSPHSTRDGSPSSTTSSVLPSNLIQSPPVPPNPRLPNIHASNVQQSPIFPPPPFLVTPSHSGNDPRMVRPPVFQNHQFLPRLPQYFPHDNTRLPFSGMPSQIGLHQSPPITVLVPYPVILPLPLPIPVPIPLIEIAKAFNSNRRPDLDIKTEPVDDTGFDVPLDFTMHNKEQGSPGNTFEENTDEISTEHSTYSNEKQHEIPNSSILSPSRETVNARDSNEDNSNPEHTIPRFKITRLGAKMAKIVTKTKEVPESARPLRKRRRLVDVTSDEECNALINKNRKTVPV